MRPKSLSGGPAHGEEVPGELGRSQRHHLDHSLSVRLLLISDRPLGSLEASSLGALSAPSGPFRAVWAAPHQRQAPESYRTPNTSIKSYAPVTARVSLEKRLSVARRSASTQISVVGREGGQEQEIPSDPFSPLDLSHNNAVSVPSETGR